MILEPHYFLKLPADFTNQDIDIKIRCKACHWYMEQIDRRMEEQWQNLSFIKKKREQLISEYQKLQQRLKAIEKEYYGI